jgi:hypothetical protein
MRFQRPVPGDRRRARGFLLFPKKIAGEIRWFENARWVEEYMDVSDGLGWAYTWVPIYWLDDDDE